MSLLLQGRPVLVQACIFGMPVFRVVVDYELRIPRDDASLVRHHEGVDLDELGVLFPEEIVGMADDRGDLFTDVLVQDEAPQEGPDHVRLEAEHGRDVLHEQVLPWDLLHVDAAHCGRHQERLPSGPVDCEAQVEFLPDVEALLQVHLLHAVPMDVHAEDLGRDFACFFQGLRGSDTAGFPTASDEHLGLHHAGERRIHDVFRPRREDAARNWNLVAGEDLLRLVLKELHRGPSRR